MNYIDLIIILVIIGFAVSGYYKGAMRQVGDIVSLLLAIFVSVVFYDELALKISSWLSLNTNISKLIAFFVLWVGVQFVFNIIFHFLYPVIPETARKSTVNRSLGALPGILWGGIFSALIIMVLVVAPIQFTGRDAVVNSASGKLVMAKSASVENYLSHLMGGAINETLTFLTVKPNSGETLDLGYKVKADALSVDEESENKMLVMVNKERTTRGLRALKMDAALQRVARAHSKDMFERGYFAHVNPDGQDPFDRMKEQGINYRVAGENLALAPNVDLAHQGLMNSPGHRANILTAEFGLVGLGCIDGGSYGKMFSQEFTN